MKHPEPDELRFLIELEELLKSRKREMPEGSYTSRLFEEGIDRIAQKVGEEAVEVVISSKNGDRKDTISESADLIYHLLVLLVERDINFEEVLKELKGRHNG
ncbi:MAG: phosphoribosyl-ATP diphosphatase [Balneolaceae bacterium]